MQNPPNVTFLEAQTQALIDWVQQLTTTAENDFTAAQQIVRRLGAHYYDGLTEIGFWAPELLEQGTGPEAVWLEVLTAPDTIDLTARDQTLYFHRQRLPIAQYGQWLWGAYEGMIAGTREQVGNFYRIVYQDRDGVEFTIADHLAYSVPFGVFAPAELYDMQGMQAARTDLAHFQALDTWPDDDGINRINPPVNILQVHVNTASEEGTLAGLTRIYTTIAKKIRDGLPLTPAEENYIGYDAVQLMPIEPPIEHEAGPLFWREVDGDQDSNQRLVTLRQHDITNWGYDVMISAAPAPNPSVLGSKRPDELVDFIAALHNFPGKPIKAMFDIVYGHTDNQALPLLNRHYLAGSNMYGQNMNYLHPVTRAILIEMQRRKSNYGVDGIRVDGAQDFKWYDPESDQMIHDDAYLRLMNDIVQEVAGVQYRPWMIFEDGRPWPREDWELASTYREITRQMPNVWQWGPLTFAHNTPFLFTFWMMKWWRLEEMTQVGSHWITGCANHDTLRRGTQVATDARINTYLGDTLPEIFQNAYDNPAAKLFDYAMMPGVPMDFINASMRAPWGFFRNTDDTYSVKVVSEESRFLDWTMTEERFAWQETFPRLKSMGFTRLDELKRFMKILDHAVQATDYNLVAVAQIMQNITPPLYGPQLTIETLKNIARAWMDDVQAYCNVSLYASEVDGNRAGFNRAVREFRQDRPWLMADLRQDEFFDYDRPTDGTVLFYGLRRAPDNSEEVLFVANMEGAPRTLNPLELFSSELGENGWTVGLVTPDVDVASTGAVVTLHDSEGVVFVRKSG